MANLCSLADVRSAMQMVASETDQDAEITAMLPQVTLAIMRHCSREFVPWPGVNATTRQFAWTDADLDFERYDLQAATSVTLDSDTNPIALTAPTDYRLLPITTPADGVYTGLRITTHRPTDYPGRDRPRIVTIQGTWGFNAVPEDVKRWAVFTVATWLRTGTQAFADAPGALGDPMYLPMAAKLGLKSFRRYAT